MKKTKKIFTGLLVFLLLLCWGGVSSAGTTFYHRDVLGTTLAQSDESGHVVWWANYDPYGSKNSGNSQDTKPQRYTGKEFDEDTGLYYFGARYYNPKLARFVSIDPASGVFNNPQTWNRYSYALNNPYKFFDPDGRSSIDIYVDRKDENGIRTLGEINITNSATKKELSLKSLEKPDRDNEKDVSRIKSDVYNADISSHPTLGDVIRLEDANDRTGILIHPGNRPDQTKGCILPGTGQTEDTVTHSQDAQRSIIDYVKEIKSFDKANNQPTNIRVIVSDP